MGKFGFGKKGEDDEDSKRSALFGSRSKNKSPNPAAVNPYAQPASASDPYTQAKLRVSQGLPARGPSPGLADPGGDAKRGINGFPAPSPEGGYGGMKAGAYGDPPAGASSAGGGSRNGGTGYGADKYGTSGGYGTDRYGNGASAPQSTGGSSRYGPGGYGGLGDPSAPEADREALFGGARERQQQRTQQPAGAPPPYGADYGQQDSSAPGGYGDSSNSYQPYGDRQLTAEEEEEEDVEATKQQIKFIKQEDVSSTRNALRIAAQAEETGQNTLARLGAQSERIHNAEKNLDLTSNNNRIAEDKQKELKKLNGSMFAVHVSNPFTGASRRQARDDAIMDRHRMEREQREATRRAGYQTSQRMNKTFQELQKEGHAPKPGQASLAERAKYQFEADEEDDEMENEIDANLTALSGAATRLNGIARATGEALEEDNKHLERINQKVKIHVCTWNEAQVC
ncbi:MAG: hypothetical protein LQ352_006079 [Teloschistes flavicans]|nr:MAG: hypothetical protein LQ352_006079 [Teloschistes flavicans]